MRQPNRVSLPDSEVCARTTILRRCHDFGRPGRFQANTGLLSGSSRVPMLTLVCGHRGCHSHKQLVFVSRNPFVGGAVRLEALQRRSIVQHAAYRRSRPSRSAQTWPRAVAFESHGIDEVGRNVIEPRSGGAHQGQARQSVDRSGRSAREIVGSRPAPGDRTQARSDRRPRAWP